MTSLYEIDKIFSEIKMEKTIQKREKRFYESLSETISNGNLKVSAELIDNSFKLDIHLNPQKIPYLITNISELLIECIHNLNLGEIFNVLSFCNEYNLIKIKLSQIKEEIIQECQEDLILMKNLHDLFGRIHSSFLAYLRFEMPKNLYQYYKDSTYFSEGDYGIDMITNFLNHYVIYGLSIQNLGKAKSFLQKVEKQYSPSNFTLERFIFHGKTHLICPGILIKMKNMILSSDYKFYNLSMIILRGIGPQGLGFSYSTPKGEIIEICSDRKENEAIIIKFRQFLKENFIKEIESQLIHYSMEKETVKLISQRLMEIINQYALIGYFKYELILKEIVNFLSLLKQDDNTILSNIDMIIEKVENSLLNVLRPIEIVDQFKTRIDLVINKKLNLEDVAKLTSLKEKSHYDILRERVFFQYIVEWFHKYYLEKVKK